MNCFTWYGDHILLAMAGISSQNESTVINNKFLQKVGPILFHTYDNFTLN